MHISLSTSYIKHIFALQIDLQKLDLKSKKKERLHHNHMKPYGIL